jgi:GT2 family glycosyltransferase
VRSLLSYSAELFDPGRPPEEQSQWGSSANVISRTLYAILARRGETTFVDATTPEDVAGESFDVFIGIQRNFGRFLEGCEIGRSILVAVNMHPAEHNSLLLDFVVSENLPASALHPLDLLDADGRAAEISAADAILLFGNVATFNSYVRRGVPGEKIRLVNSASDLGGAPSGGKRRSGGTGFLYCASEIGLRKGFDVVEATFGEADLEGLGARLQVVGRASYPHYRERLARFEERLGASVTDHGWLPATSPEYREVLDSVDYVFFPSLEEGQAGTVLDAMACGVIPLISANSGIDFAPLGFCELGTASDRNLDLLREACELPDAERDRLRAKTLEYYDEFHGDFERRLEGAVDDLLAGVIRPAVSAILPVHNKAAVLSDLLTLLDRALLSYGAADLRVILDGCTDASEEIVRRFFAGRKDYPVEILVTPDIFEVRSNNLGLKKAQGRYAMIVQDDNFIYDRSGIFEAVTLMEKSRRAAIVGGLAGVNYYPRGTRGLEGPGQIVASEDEVYWRQDADTDPELEHRIFQVDACMRGPLFFSKAFLDEHGYLDEAFVPLHADDMDICLRAASVGQKVYCVLMDVDNDSLSMATFDAEKSRWFTEVAKRNLDLFYRRWQLSTEKDYLWIHRTRPSEERTVGERILRARQRARRRYLAIRRRWLNVGTAARLLRRAGLRSSWRPR